MINIYWNLPSVSYCCRYLSTMRKKWGEGRSGLLDPGFYYYLCYYFLLFYQFMGYLCSLKTFLLTFKKTLFLSLMQFFKSHQELFNMMKSFGRLDINDYLYVLLLSFFININKTRILYLIFIQEIFSLSPHLLLSFPNVH